VNTESDSIITYFSQNNECKHVPDIFLIWDLTLLALVTTMVQ